MDRLGAGRGNGIGLRTGTSESFDCDLAWAVGTLERLALLLRTEPHPAPIAQLLGERYAELVGENGTVVGLLHAQVEVVGTSDAAAALAVEDFERRDGPLAEVASSGTPTLGVELGPQCRWPTFGRRARAAGYLRLEAVAMHTMAGAPGGVVAIFHRSRHPMEEYAAELLESFANLAASTLSAVDQLRESQRRVLQLEQALNSRIRIEQAKGLLAERLGIDVATTFELMRQYSRNRNLPIDEVADRLLARELNVRELISGARRPRQRRDR